MEYTIHIDYSSLQIDISRRRMEALQQFEVRDRVPVLLGVTNQYLLPQLEMGFLEFFDDPERHLYYQLLGWQWLLENLGDDRLIEEELEVIPNFDNTTTAGLFDMQHILWRDEVPPTFVPWLETVRDVVRLRLPNSTDNMGGQKLSYIEEMQFLVNKFHVWLQGEPILLRVGPGWQEGPFTAALAMAGEQVFDWAEEEPNALHDLLAMIPRPPSSMSAPSGSSWRRTWRVCVSAALVRRRSQRRCTANSCCPIRCRSTKPSPASGASICGATSTTCWNCWWRSRGSRISTAVAMRWRPNT
jgi:hypothetical protein